MSKYGVIDIIKSVIAAAIGVQSEKNRQQDFEHGSLTKFIIAGLIFTILFVSALVFLVSNVLGA